MLSCPRERGFSLIELMIGLAVLGIVIMVGLPNLTTWIQNAQIKTAAEGVQAGLQYARAEALRRNASVRFQFVNSLTNSCALSTAGTNFVVSLTDPSGACSTAPSDAGPVLQTRSGAEGSQNAAIAATGGSLVTFNGLGRLVGAGNFTQVNITNPGAGTCQASGGTMRCLRLVVTTGGQIRMCDPAVTEATDPRYC